MSGRDVEATAPEEQRGSRRRLVTWLAVGGVVVVLGLLAAVFAGRFGKDPRIVDSPLIGETATPLVLERLDGSGPLDFSTLQGEVVVVNFWASWCIPCRTEHGYLTSAQSAYADQSVQFVGIVFQDTEEAATRFLNDLGYGEGYEYVLDPGSRAAVEFGVFGVPETFFIDRSGYIVHKIAGPVSPVSLTSALDDILAGRSPEA
jgi:cytochrome c biogenesis protein CcmG/thiol:disulfide interchange protein DsbE